MGEQEKKRIILKVAYNYYQSEKWERALEEYKKLVDLDPMDFLIHNMIAQIYIHQEKKEPAINEFMKAVNLLRATNSLDKALQTLQHILKLEPERKETKIKIEEVIRVRLVEVDEFILRGSLKNAAEICERLAEKVPGHSLVADKMAEIETRRVEQQARRSKATPAPGDVFQPTGEASGKDAEGMEKNAEVVKNLYLLAARYEERQAWDEAVETYITILRLQPQDAEARRKLHDLYHKISRHDKAATVWTRINSESQKSIERAKQLAKAGPSLPPAGESNKSKEKMEKLKIKAEEQLRHAVKHKRNRDKTQKRKMPEAGKKSASQQTQAESKKERELNEIMTQAAMYINQNLLVEAMQLCQRILELDSQNVDVRGLLKQIYAKKNL
jgi:tetratricopeptide (TPR) repeat protein